MTSKQPAPWKHHFVPRSLLKYFQPSIDADFIYVCDKSDGRVFRTSLMNAASQNGFNTLEDGDDVVNFESDFDAVDALLASRLREIHATEFPGKLTVEQRQDWADLVSVQMVRTPIVRTTMKAIVEDLRDQVAENFGTDLVLPVPTETDMRKAARGLFARREDMHQALAEKDVVFFTAPVGATFRISDRPVVLESSLPFGDAGVSSHGVAIYLPLGQRLMLGMFCPTIGRKLNRVPLEALDLPDDNCRARLVALRDGIATGAPIQLDAATVQRHNDQHIANCSRFVYGPTRDFADVESLLAAQPQYREVKSSIRVGKMGHGPGPRPDMPMGAWLVLFGRTTAHMLEVSDENRGDPLEVTVNNRAALREASADGPFSEMQYYVDQLQLRMMRNVHLSFVGDDGRVQVSHLDPGLDALMRTIASRDR